MTDDYKKKRASQRAATRRESQRIQEQTREEVTQLYHQRSSYLNAARNSRVSDDNLGSSDVLKAIGFVVADRVQKVLTSFDFNPKVRVAVEEYFSKPIEASTNYHEINVKFSSQNIQINDPEKLADALLALRGVIYHEGGHILYTLPFKALFDCSLMDRGYVPVSIKYGFDRSEYAATYPAYHDEIHGNDLRMIYDETNWRSDESGREYILKHSSKDDIANEIYKAHASKLEELRNSLAPTWGILEDGRMEAQMCYNNGTMREYFEVLTIQYLVDENMPGFSWPGVASRYSHISPEVYETLRQFAYQYTKLQGIDPSLVDQIEEQVRVYRQSKTPADVVDSVIVMKRLLDKWNPNGNHHGDNSGSTGKHPGDKQHDSRGRDENSEVIVNEKPRFGEESQGWEKVPGENGEPDNGQPGENGDGRVSRPGDKSGEGEGKGEAKGESDKSDGEGPNEDGGERTPNNHAGKSGTGGIIKDVNYRELRDKLRKKLDNMKRDLSSVDDAQEFIADVNKELREPIPHNSATSAMAPEMVSKSIEVANKMLSALEPLAVTADPAWRFRQENGVLDPTTYMMHEPGDTDYWVDYEGEGSQGHNLAVSVMLDVSASMDAWMDELSIAAYGIRSACDNLGIPCTVTTFDTEAALIWGHDEDAEPKLIHDGGGTNPTENLIKVSEQRLGKLRHLIVILTDGQWGGVSSIRPFVEPGQYWVLVGLSTSKDWGLALVKNKGADVEAVIEDVMELPSEVQKALTGFLQ